MTTNLLRTPWTSSSGAIMNADGRLVCYPISGDTDDHDRAIAAAIVKAVNEAYAEREPPGCRTTPGFGVETIGGATEWFATLDEAWKSMALDGPQRRVVKR